MSRQGGDIFDEDAKNCSGRDILKMDRVNVFGKFFDCETLTQIELTPFEVSFEIHRSRLKVLHEHKGCGRPILHLRHLAQVLEPGPSVLVNVVVDNEKVFAELVSAMAKVCEGVGKGGAEGMETRDGCAIRNADAEPI